MDILLVIIALIIIMYIVFKFYSDDGSVEMPRLFDIPLSYWLSAPKDGYRCIECWDEYKDDIKVCADCNKDIVDFSELNFFPWKIDYNALDKIGFIYDK